MMDQAAESLRFRTIFISNALVGSNSTNYSHLLGFLQSHVADFVILCGDMIDGRHLRGAWTWPQPCHDLVKTLLDKAERGTKIIYVPGRRDAFLLDFIGQHFGVIEIGAQYVHQGADGRRYLVSHASDHGALWRIAHSLRYLSAFTSESAKSLLLFCDHLAKRRWFPAVGQGRPSRHLRQEAWEHGCDGIILGTGHEAMVSDEDGFALMQSGGWTDHCSALVECHDGRFEAIVWGTLVDRQNCADIDQIMPVERKSDKRQEAA